jgi:hypothetical protein
MHRGYAHLLGEDVLSRACHLPAGFDFVVVKYRLSTGAVTFIECPDFDTAPEPAIGRTCLVTADGTCRLRQALADPFIYHHKWLFVAEDYEGFDVAASRRRSASWMRVPGIDYARIGRASYWKDKVAPLIG